MDVGSELCTAEFCTDTSMKHKQDCSSLLHLLQCYTIRHIHVPGLSNFTSHNTHNVLLCVVQPPIVSFHVIIAVTSDGCRCGLSED